MLVEQLSVKDLHEYIARCKSWLDRHGWEKKEMTGHLAADVMIGKENQWRVSVTRLLKQAEWRLTCLAEKN